MATLKGQLQRAEMSHTAGASASTKLTSSCHPSPPAKGPNQPGELPGVPPGGFLERPELARVTLMKVQDPRSTRGARGSPGTTSPCR